MANVVAAGFSVLSATPVRRHKVGHTGITWGYPAPNALHPHTGSCIQTRDEIYPVQVVKDFLSVIAHVHLKDFDGGSRHEGYCPVGKGRVDIQGVVEVLETSVQDFMLMAELNPAPGRDGNVSGVYQLAQASKRKLAALGYGFS